MVMFNICHSPVQCAETSYTCHIIVRIAALFFIIAIDGPRL